MKSNRVCVPVFIAALSLIAALLVFAFVLFAVGGDATALAAVYVLFNGVQYGLVQWAFQDVNRRA